MGLALFFGCLILVLGPLIVLFAFFIAKHNQLVILSIGSSFFWLVSILITSILWFVVKPLHEVFYFIVPFGTLFQELVRYGFWVLYNKAYNTAEFKDDPTKPSNFAASFAIGWGIAATMSLVMHVSVLWSALGVGDLPSPACPSVSTFHIHALVTLAMSLLHIILSILLFDAYSKKAYILIAFGVLMHFLASLFSIFNQKVSCVAGTLLPWIIVLISAFVTFKLIISNKTSLVRYHRIK